MHSQRLDGLAVLRIGVGVGQPDDDAGEVGILASAGSAFSAALQSAANCSSE